MCSFRALKESHLAYLKIKVMGERVWEIGGISPLVFNLGNRHRGLIILIAQSFYL
jgi:hypothetical protein